MTGLLLLNSMSSWHKAVKVHPLTDSICAPTANVLLLVLLLLVVVC
jgi:hypothetical protein